MKSKHKNEDRFYQFTHRETGQVKLIQAIDLEHAQQFIPWEHTEYALSITFEKPI